MSTLGAKGVTPEMMFRCTDCGGVISGKQVIDGEILHIVLVNKTDSRNSLWRCEICQLELEESSQE
jgi:uncharacterized Zn finger protein